MPSTTTTSTQVTPKKWSTELKDTGYITMEDLQAKLEEVFGSQGYKAEDYKIATRNERWTYYAPRKLSLAEMKTIIKKT